MFTLILFCFVFVCDITEYDDSSSKDWVRVSV